MDHIKVLDLRKHKGRVFFTTDLHGHFDLLHEKLKEVAFDSTKDILIVGGDLCDRGPDSQYVLDYLNEPWLYCVRGNHEELLIQAFEEGFRGAATNCLLSNGGVWVADVDAKLLKSIYESFKSLPLAIELQLPTETVGIIHAQCPYNSWKEFKNATHQELAWNAEATAQWARTNYDYKLELNIEGVDRLLVGHSPTTSGEIEVYGNTWYADLGSFFRGKISFIQYAGGR
jgi:serine/threonine protein phosphatase 1